jgi:hypothetical protein
MARKGSYLVVGIVGIVVLVCLALVKEQGSADTRAGANGG